MVHQHNEDVTEYVVGKEGTKNAKAFAVNKLLHRKRYAMFLRDEPQFKKTQEDQVISLLNEAVNGVTQRDILPNIAQPLQGEVEAMYFNAIKRFFNNSISRNVMHRNQDIFEGK